jgi:DNA excision repair protein ERCC-2
MSEIEKALVELKDLMKFRSQELGRDEEFRALGLTSRKNLCLHPSVRREKDGNVVDARCRNLTARFVKERKEKGEDVQLCEYHEVGTIGLGWLDANVLEPRKARTARSHTSWCVDS